jgi:hypothetical protein
MKRPLVALALLATAVTIAPAKSAQACGAGMAPTVFDNPSFVAGHRMIVSISQEKTILWDSIEYTGNPSSFAWVMPVAAGATIELSNEGFFEALDAVTATRVLSPKVLCQDTGGEETEGQGACGGDSQQSAQGSSSSGGGTTLEQGDPGDVKVISQGSLGPYETATITADDPTALHTWLTQNNYYISPEADPIFAYYVQQKMNFIALRFKPDPNMPQMIYMTPVRITMQGASPTLPLRSVAIGTGARVPINLYVISEGRYRAKAFPEATVEPSQITWDFVRKDSNYADLRDKALSNDSFLTAFAMQYALTDPVAKPGGTAAYYDTPLGTKDNLVDTYFAQAAARDMKPLPAGDCKDVYDLLSLAGPGAVVSDKCTGKDCPAGTIPAVALKCGDWDDLATALVGMHPSDVWVTRLQANLSHGALNTDLTLEPAPKQEPAENWFRAMNGTNIPCKVGAKAEANGSCSLRKPGRSSSALLGGMSLMGLLFALRRVTRRRKES